jgi:prepilin-type N-terminal cleavage/methylation domain-containing protein
MKKSFTLVEILIVVAILGILAAIVLPALQGHITEANESAAKDNLRILRNAIGLYAARHGGVPPGYRNNDPTQTPMPVYFASGLVAGRYLNKIPKNPFNGNASVRMIESTGLFPENADGLSGWIYQPATKTIRLNWQGTDEYGVRYYDY